mgnify:CR=1 FL=1
MRSSEAYMSEIVKEKPIMEEARKRYNNFIRSRLMRRLSAYGVTEYEKKEIYQYDKQITLEDKRREGRKEERISMAKSMKKENIDIETIKRITGLTVDEIKKL